MPSSPFGLAYGLGAGLANAPQAYTQGQQQGMAMSMQNLQLQEAIRQANETKRLNEVFSEPIKPKMEAQDVMGDVNNPEYQSQLAQQQQYDQIAQENPDHPVLSEMTRPEVTAPEKIQGKVGEKQGEHKWATQYEQMAYEMGERANRLRQLGLGRSAYQLDQESMKYGQAHRDQALRMAGQAIVGGNYNAAIPYLKSVGMDVESIKQDPEDDDNLVITRNVNGQKQEASVDKTMAMMIGADPTKAAEVYGMIQWRNAQISVKREQLDINRKRVQGQVTHWQQMDAYRRQFGNKPTALLQNAHAWMQANPGMTMAQALDAIGPGGGRRGMTQNQMVKVWQTSNKEIADRNGKQIPTMPTKPQDQWNAYDKQQAADAQVYAENQKNIEGVMGKQKPGSGSTQPTGQGNPAPEGHVVSMKDGTFRVKKNGQWVKSDAKGNPV